MNMDYRSITTKLIVPVLKQCGMKVTLRTVTGTFNASTGENVLATKDYPTYAILGGYKLTDVDGTVIQTGDRRALVADLKIVPENHDKLVIAGVVWDVVNVNPFQPGDTPVAYELQIRK